MADRVLLCADDFALSPGVSRGIAELIRAGRLSATGAMVTEPDWAAQRTALPELRSKAAIGLHLNLTTGGPLGPMPTLAPDGPFPGLQALMRLAFTGRLAAPEISAEISRQLDQFETVANMPPDFVDGHHHVQVLPKVRAALLDALSRRYPGHTPLLRNPGDTVRRIAARRGAGRKALLVTLLARGFGADAHRHGIATNEGFSGFSAFDRERAFADELTTFLKAPGPRQIVMCHPGYPDQQLAALDPLFDRRLDELGALMTYPDLDRLITRPRRNTDGRIEWLWP
ncbi:ChbG/HpnK family deacetylase [Kaistia dalseonensis]|uniref:Glycoside hydrolase/deacetylase ChbG (UPF0249 family) n=1 Tax=Kaistia dalseonensis TaxID=410840 RepID=A0ABU0HCQ4_9HYPH|nr:ChbG/HpnK family deacetylase [Kaistia dalseonensis]MCX5497022.1 ChbG/HpnK family deacetylase [Kaistia dalseonensis]MDQ0439648.1 putative glycoside hydrolase/deacetylase ChbG (UPF0249 family) [Kaistia dalseonensis]